ALTGKGNVGLLSGNIAQGIAASNKVLAQNPTSEVALTLLGACFAQRGEIASAIAHYDRAIAIKPDYEDAIMKKIFVIDFLPGVDFESHQATRRYWWEAVGAKLPRRQLGVRNFDPERRLVVGYVSSELRNHSAALALLPILRHHDHAKFE